MHHIDSHDTENAERHQALRYPIVRDLMTEQVVTVAPTTPFKDIVQLLLTWGIDGVPVVDIGDQLVGIVTEADLLSHESYGPQQAHAQAAMIPLLYRPDGPWLSKAEALTAGELMSTDVATANPDEAVRVVARRMLRQHRKQFPVVDGGRLVGIVARRDLLSIFDRDDGEITADVARALGNRSLLPEAVAVTARVDDGVVHIAGSVAIGRDIAVIRAVLGSISGVVDVVGELAGR